MGVRVSPLPLCKFPSPMVLREWSQNLSTLPHRDCAQNCARRPPKCFAYVFVLADCVLAEDALGARGRSPGSCPCRSTSKSSTSSASASVAPRPLSPSRSVPDSTRRRRQPGARPNASARRGNHERLAQAIELVAEAGISANDGVYWCIDCGTPAGKRNWRRTWTGESGLRSTPLFLWASRL